MVQSLFAPPSFVVHTATIFIADGAGTPAKKRCPVRDTT